MNTAQVVEEFILSVRSGKNPEAASMYMAELVLAHQIISGETSVVERTPENYAEHVREFLECFGPFELTIDEFLIQNDKVYVRWTQRGHHLGMIEGFQPTGKPLHVVGSAVYRVENQRIVEYCIQQENHGLLSQLQQQQD